MHWYLGVSAFESMVIYIQFHFTFCIENYMRTSHKYHNLQKLRFIYGQFNLSDTIGV